MTKRIISLVLGLLLLAGSALADLPDFTSMSFEELNAIKQALDMEYFSRPEAEGRNLGPGIYTAGADFKPGTYYIGVVYPDAYGGSVPVQIQKGEDRAVRSYMTLGDAPLQTILNDGDNVYVESGKVYLSPKEYDPSELYQYQPPEGTRVPEGVYFVGEDIPAGRYSVYPGEVPGGRYEVYVRKTDEDGSTRYVYKSEKIYQNTVWVTAELKPVVIDLDDGDKIQIKNSVIMKKTEKTKLVFN